MRLSVYVHIPFCKTKCHYCDFISVTGSEKLFLPYVETLISEIKAFDFSGYEIDTVFIGGGTPTVLPPYYIQRILNKILNNRTVSNAEVTIEANPNTISKEFLRVAVGCGVNRLSIGLQSHQERLLKILGRSHSFENFLNSCELAYKEGLKNINTDLMFSIPTQTVQDLTESIEKVTETGIPHISLYSLIIEENTLFFDLYKEFEDDQDRHLYHLSKKILSQKNYVQYEISNFSKKGFECRHNINYWDRREYIGFGAAAHSFINGCRFYNDSDINKYILKNERQGIITLSEKDAIEEFMFLGLRKTRGIDKECFFNSFNKNVRDVYGDKINKFISQGFLKEEDNRIYLTDNGIDVSNIIFSEFLF